MGDSGPIENVMTYPPEVYGFGELVGANLWWEDGDGFSILITETPGGWLLEDRGEASFRYGVVRMTEWDEVEHLAAVIADAYGVDLHNGMLSMKVTDPDDLTAAINTMCSVTFLIGALIVLPEAGETA